MIPAITHTRKDSLSRFHNSSALKKRNIPHVARHITIKTEMSQWCITIFAVYSHISGSLFG